jgi:lipoprotein-releasing system ATP-binding protein
MKNILAAENLSKFYTQGSSTIPVLSDLSIQFEQGKSYAIMGISGCGKSTLMHLLSGIDNPSKGTVSYNGKSINALSILEKNYFRSQTIGLVFQYAYLIKELLVIENVMVKGLIGGDPYQDCYKNAEKLLHALGLSEKSLYKPSQLSGGQQQRVAVARALVNKPTFLLADEPTGNLDEKTGTEFIQLLLQLQKEWQIGLIISTHDSYVAQSMQEIYELHQGKLIKK